MKSSFSVRDQDRSLRFYVDEMGFNLAGFHEVRRSLEAQGRTHDERLEAEGRAAQELHEQRDDITLIIARFKA